MTGPDFARMKGDLARLIAIRTENPPGQDENAAAFVRERLVSEGLDADLSKYAPGRFNVVGRLTNGPGPVLAFNTHMDVVPAGEGWISDPFVIKESDGVLIGRGACDCKGPLAAMLEAIRMLAGCRHRWAGTLLGVFVGDEEVASSGAKHYAASKPAIDFAVVGEPTSNGTVIAHKGSLRLLVRVTGVAAHSSTPDSGDNAIYRAARLIAFIEEHHTSVVRRRSHPLVGAASLTVTRIHGGVADNVVPDHVELLLDRRMVPGETEAEATAEIEVLLRTARSRFGVQAEVVECRPTSGGASETARDEPIVQASLAASRRHGAPAPGPLGFSGACDLVHFNGIGAKGVVIGPGSLDVAHKPNEFVPIDEFIAASLIYRDIAFAMLGRSA